MTKKIQAVAISSRVLVIIKIQLQFGSPVIHVLVKYLYALWSLPSGFLENLSRGLDHLLAHSSYKMFLLEE